MLFCKLSSKSYTFSILYFSPMLRKLYALFILIGTLGALLLVYLYFFVYYTSIIELSTNTDNYQVELFSQKTAKKWVYSCNENPCILSGVAPLSYMIHISATWFQKESFSEVVPARSRIQIQKELEKQARLRLWEDWTIRQPLREIERLREEKQYAARFDLYKEQRAVIEVEETLATIYIIDSKGKRKITSFSDIALDRIVLAPISESRDVFMYLWEKQYIYQADQGNLIEIQFPFKIKYIKQTQQRHMYHLVSEEGSFLYDITDKSFEYQYLFHDFIYDWKNIIGVLKDEEEQKKKNFSLSQRGTLLVYYDISSKDKRVLLTIDGVFEAIEEIEGNVIIKTNSGEYILENYK